MERPSEVTDYHGRLVSCSLEAEHCRAYWQHVAQVTTELNPEIAFAEYWFGARSLPRVQVLLANFRERFNRFPMAVPILHQWKSMDSLTRQLICHCFIKTRFEIQPPWMVSVRRRRTGETVARKARRFHRGLWFHAEDDDVEKHLRHGLRLYVIAG